MLIKSLFWQIINSIVKICLEIFVFDRKIRRILKGNWAKFYLRKYVVKGTSFSPHPSPLLKGEGMTKTVQSLQEISPHPNPPPIKGGDVLKSFCKHNCANPLHEHYYSVKISSYSVRIS